MIGFYYNGTAPAKTVYHIVGIRAAIGQISEFYAVNGNDISAAMCAVVRTVERKDLENPVPNAGFGRKRNEKLIAEIGQSRTDGGYRSILETTGISYFLRMVFNPPIWSECSCVTNIAPTSESEEPTF